MIEKDLTIKNGEESLAEETPNQNELPVLNYSREIKETISSNETAIIVGPTGSGKTTQIPLLLLETLSPDDKIAILQPRVFATKSVARYVAENVGCRIGEDVGYQVRFEDHTTEGTRINFMTDGIMLRKIQEDPLLLNYSAVMVDEAHERSLNIDFALGLLKRAQKKRKEAGLAPLIIIVTSATLEKEKFATYFDGSPIVEVPGRQYPVDIHYLPEEQRALYDYTAAAANQVADIIESNKPGDILIFMPGQEEIDKTIKNIEALKLPDIVVLPFFSQISPEEQDKILEKKTERKIIVATNIAETSITVPGVRLVIDSGLIKQTEFDASTGIETLAARPHAKSGCTQRAGRAGRREPGECWRLYPESDFNNRQEFQIPEIQRSNLDRVVLLMKKIGIDDVKSFEFMDPPDAGAFEQALNTLKTLGALDENEQITEIGGTMVELPLEPHIARMVVEAEKHECVESVCTIASFLGGKPVFVFNQGWPEETKRKIKAAQAKFKNPTSDFMSLFKIWQEYETNDYRDNWARENFLNSKTLNEVRQIRYQLLHTLRRNGIRASQNQEPESIGKAVAAGLIENLMVYDSKHAYKRIKDKQTGFFIHPSSSTFGNPPKFLVASEIVKTGKTYARNIQEIKSQWIREIAPQLTREEPKETDYDQAGDRIVRKISIYLKNNYDAILEEERLVEGEEAVKVFAEALAQGKIDAQFVKHNKEVMETVNDLWQRAEGKLLNMEQPFSTENLKTFYAERLGTISSKKDLDAALLENKINLELNINELVSPEQREKILRENPDSIDVIGTPRSIKYGYDSWSKKFTASAKIPAADVLKLAETPVLPSGRVLLLEIISKEGETYSQFSGINLEELKQKSKQFLIKKQWDEWRYSEKSPKEQLLTNFDPIGELPQLPETLQFGVDPETNEPLLAFPAVSAETSSYSSRRYLIKFFSSQEEAGQAQNKTLEIITQLKNEQIKKEEKERLVAPTRELSEKIRNSFNIIGYNYSDYGLSYDEKSDIGDKLRQAERILESETKEALEILQTLDARISKALKYNEQKKSAKEKTEAAIAEHYSVCPLCGKPMAGECTNAEHDAEKIDYNLDEEGYEDGPAILSQILTDQKKIVAELRCSHGEAGRRRSSHYRGDIYVVTGSETGENAWLGEPFESLEFEDFGKILTPEQIEARKDALETMREEKNLEEARTRYQADLEYAKQQMEQNYWRRGKFTKSTHPKTGEEQWESTIKGKGLVVKYVVDRWSQQPSADGLDYFYSTGKTLVDTRAFRLILVNLERPFPEDKPKEKELPPAPPQEQIEVGPTPQKSVTASLEELKKKWGVK